MIVSMSNKGDPNDVGNYNNNNMLSCLSKLLIPVINDSLQQWRARYSELPDAQAEI